MDIAVYISWALLAASIGYMLTASACVIMFEGKCAKASQVHFKFKVHSMQWLEKRDGWPCCWFR